MPDTDARRLLPLHVMGEGEHITRRFIPVAEAFNEWRKAPEYVAAYDALEEEFALAAAQIKVRGDEGLCLMPEQEPPVVTPQ